MTREQLQLLTFDQIVAMMYGAGWIVMHPPKHAGDHVNVYHPGGTQHYWWTMRPVQNRFEMTITCPHKTPITHPQHDRFLDIGLKGAYTSKRKSTYRYKPKLNSVDYETPVKAMLILVWQTMEILKEKPAVSA